MFYAHFVLSKKGPLARIWLAAHWDKKLTKAHIFETSIEGSVEAIIQPQVKLALRTSGHLLLGVVRIYSRKAKYLLADCNEVLVKIKLSFRPGLSVDLPEDTREAALSAITLQENFHDFELETAVTEIPDFSEPFNDTLLHHRSVPERITLREPIRSEIFFGSDGFGDFGFEEFGLASVGAEMLADYRSPDPNLVPLPSVEADADKSPSSTSSGKLAGCAVNPQSDSRDGKIVEGNELAIVESRNGEVPPTDTNKEPGCGDVSVEPSVLYGDDESRVALFDESIAAGGGVGGLFDETLAGGMSTVSDGTILGLGSPQTRSAALKKKADAMYAHGEEEAPPVENKIRRKTLRRGEDGDQAAGAGDQTIGAGNQTAGDQTMGAVNQTSGRGDQTMGAGDQTVDVGDQTTRTVVPDQTTLIQNVSQAFALAPIDTTGLNTTERKKKKKRKLIVDDTKALSSDTIKGHMKTTSGIVLPLDLAPPTKRLMHWKDIGTFDRLVCMSARSFANSKLCAVFDRNLMTRIDSTDFDAVEDEETSAASADVSDIEVMRAASQHSLDESEVEKRRATADRSSLLADHSQMLAPEISMTTADDPCPILPVDISTAQVSEPFLNESLFANGNVTLTSLPSSPRVESDLPVLPALDVTLTEDDGNGRRRSSARLRGVRASLQSIPPSPLARPLEETSVAGTPRKETSVAGTPRKETSVAGTPRKETSVAGTPRKNRQAKLFTPIPCPLSPQVNIVEPASVIEPMEEDGVFDFTIARRKDDDMRCSGRVLQDLEQEEADVLMALHRRTAFLLQVLGRQFDELDTSHLSTPTSTKRKSKSSVPLVQSKEVRFSSLVMGNNRKQVAAKFSTVLLLKKLQAVGVKQNTPYDEIVLTKGPKFSEVCSTAEEENV